MATTNEVNHANIGSDLVFQFEFDSTMTNYDQTFKNGLCFRKKETGNGFCWFNLIDGNAGTTYIMDQSKFDSLNSWWDDSSVTQGD